MGRLNLKLSNELEEKFRKEVGKRLGMKKGNLKKALTEAVELWIKQEETIKTEKDL